MSEFRPDKTQDVDKRRGRGRVFRTDTWETTSPVPGGHWFRVRAPDGGVGRSGRMGSACEPGCTIRLGAELARRPLGEQSRLTRDQSFRPKGKGWSRALNWVKELRRYGISGAPPCS